MAVALALVQTLGPPMLGLSLAHVALTLAQALQAVAVALELAVAVAFKLVLGLY